MKHKQILFFILCLIFQSSASAIAKDNKPISTDSTSLNIATLNMNMVNARYSLILEAREDIFKSEQSLKKLILTANKEIDQLNKDKNAQDISTKQKNIQASIDKAYLDLEEKKKNYNDQKNKNIELSLAKIANNSNYDLILNEVYTVSSDQDITDSFIEELEKLKR